MHFLPQEGISYILTVVHVDAAGFRAAKILMLSELREPFHCAMEGGVKTVLCHMLFTFENNRLVLHEFWSIKDMLYNVKASCEYLMLLSF